MGTAWCHHISFCICIHECTCIHYTFLILHVHLFFWCTPCTIVLVVDLLLYLIFEPLNCKYNFPTSDNYLYIWLNILHTYNNSPRTCWTSQHPLPLSSPRTTPPTSLSGPSTSSASSSECRPTSSPSLTSSSRPQKGSAISSTFLLRGWMWRCVLVLLS